VSGIYEKWALRSAILRPTFKSSFQIDAKETPIPRLKTHIWVSALMTRALSEGSFAVVAKKGDRDSGTVILAVRQRGGATRLYQAATGMDGLRVWHESEAKPAREIDAVIALQSARDMDLWVIEIEDREGRHFLTEPVVSAVQL